MVTAMNADQRKAAFAEAKARSYQTLARVAHVTVEHRTHRDDGMLTEHSVNMPRKPPPPTMVEIEQKIAASLADIDSKIAAALAEQARGQQAFVDGRIAAALTDDNRLNAHGKVISDERKRWRAEIEKLRSEHDLRLSALLQATEKLERGIGDDRGNTVIDLPAFVVGKRHAS